MATFLGVLTMGFIPLLLSIGLIGALIVDLAFNGTPKKKGTNTGVRSPSARPRSSQRGASFTTKRKGP